MRATVRRLVFWGALFAAVAFVVILTNQTLQLAEFGARIHPRLGDAIFWGVLFLLVLSLSVPLVLLLRLPRALVPPKEEEGPEFEEHLRRLRERLSANPLVREKPMDTRAGVEGALESLDTRATEVIHAAGSRAFLTTAISQNGALDALLVLGIQARLIWDVSRVYTQRPALTELTYLYSNVLTTAFIAGEIDDADVSEAMQPALSAVMGSVAGAVPGLQVASAVFVNSVLSGTANAFLTLRVGIIAQQYSRALTRPQRSTLRRLAVVRAGGMLGTIAVAGAGKVSSTIGRATGRMFTGAMSGAGKRIVSTGSALKSHLPFVGRPETDPDPTTP